MKVKRMGKTIKTSNFDFEKIYELYPRRQGKKIGIQRCNRFIGTKNQYEALIKAVQNYRSYCLSEALEKKFIKLFSSFMSEWEDWVDETNGSLNLAKAEDKWKNETIRILKDKE